MVAELLNVEILVPLKIEKLFNNLNYA